jgi:PAS domain S-box-containing protein
LSTQHGWFPYPAEIVEVAQNGFVTLDSAGRILYLNRSSSSVLSLSREDADGADLAEIAVGEQDRQRLAQTLAALKADDHPEPRETRLEVVLSRGPAGEMPVELSIGAMRVDEEWIFHVWMHDVSERTQLLRELEANLRETGPGLTDILDAMAEAVTIRDPDHHIVYANRAALDHMGFASVAEIQRRAPGSIMDDYVVEDENGRKVTMDQIPSVRLLSGDQEVEPLLIRTIERSTGVVKWQVLKASLLNDAHGKPVASVMIIEDVTRGKQAELRERFLAQVTDTLMSSIDYAETLGNVAWLAVPEIADWCAVDLLDEQGGREQVVVAHTDEAKLQLAERLRLRQSEYPEETGTERVARTGVPELYNDITDEMLVQGAIDEDHLALLRAVGFRSALVVPLRARGRTLGVMTLVNSESLRRFDEGDQEFAQQLAGRAAIAVDNARLATSRREIAETLQRSLLPDADPEIEGWDVATIYRPASMSGEVEVGGDFYDFIETDRGWVVLLGDVTGRGVEAATLTSLVRHGARFLAKDGLGPSSILTRVDQALRERPELSLCTALCLRLEDDTVTLSSAGHPAPLIVGDDGSVRELGGTGPLLGGWEESAWTDQIVDVGENETLVMYTDGVTDTRGESGRFGTASLRDVLAANAGKPPAQLLAALEAALDEFQVAGRSDDTGAVALRRTAVREPANGPG